MSEKILAKCGYYYRQNRGLVLLDSFRNYPFYPMFMAKLSDIEVKVLPNMVHVKAQHHVLEYHEGVCWLEEGDSAGLIAADIEMRRPFPWLFMKPRRCIVPGWVEFVDTTLFEMYAPDIMVRIIGEVSREECPD